ncbi:hypothetical protein Ddye_013271 [Dipteronia dyeriana]|uniref:Uncharacterized protein n=1 Tax=Dipteronia dyeriana TaxID=168575 RepID=A0AAD9X5U6_9ROSI|nr:hypothetical protein Ddye_013271 [Dipteronia dyeriana]
MSSSTKTTVFFTVLVLFLVFFTVLAFGGLVPVFTPLFSLFLLIITTRSYTTDGGSRETLEKGTIQGDAVISVEKKLKEMTQVSGSTLIFMPYEAFTTALYSELMQIAHAAEQLNILFCADVCLAWQGSRPIRHGWWASHSICFKLKKTAV